jgi:predicted esterase
MGRNLNVILLTVFVCAWLPATRVTAAAPPATAPTTAGSYTVARADVAMAYLELDRLYANAKLTDDERARLNRKFDEATILYFRNQPSDAVHMIHELIDSLAPAGRAPLSAEARLARSLRVRLSPWVAQARRTTPLRVSLSPMYSLVTDAPVKLHLVIRPDAPDSAESKPVFDRELEIDARGKSPAFIAPQPDAPVGAYRVELVAPDGTRSYAGRWFVAQQPSEIQRRSNIVRMNGLRQDSQQIILATAAVAARNNLMADQFNEVDGARFTSDPIRLMSDVTGEIEQLENDRDPFVDRAGDYWRTILIGALQIPARIYAPKAATSGQPVPLVIALHGAGGEEALFMEAYGHGQIKRLADEKGFLLVAPSTYYTMTSPDALEGIVHALSYDYLIDPKRIYVIGHSLGAMTAQSFATRWPDRVAAVCMIAGGTPFPNQKRMAPTLMLGADVDPILAGVGMDLKKVSDDATRNGLPIEFRMIRNEGHTLIVTDVMPDAINWLLKHELPK